MKLTKNQVERICSTLSVRRPCINCGYDGPVNGPHESGKPRIQRIDI